jgi:hypothetical protein
MRTPIIFRRHPMAGPAVACGVAMILVACGSSGSSSSSSGDSSGNSSGNAPEEFGLTLVDLAARVDATESLIAQCMTSAGFQYVALDFVSIKEAMSSDQTAPGLSGDEYVKQFGLGITTQLEQPIVTFGAGPENAAYVQGLAPSDQTAFSRALWGETPEWNHAHSLEAEDFSQAGGCTRSASEKTYSPTEISGAYVNPADVLLEQDPRMIDAVAKWADCMRADGYQYDNPGQVEDDLRERLDAIVQGQDPSTLTGPSLDALHELQGEELAIAATLTSCEEELIEPIQAAIESELYGAPQP